MSKAEMLRQSAIEKNKANLDQLAEQVQTIRQAKAQSVEDLSAMLEPLAKALASLSSEAGQTLVQIEEATRTAGVNFERQVQLANDSLTTTITASSQATARLNKAAGNASWVHYGLTVTSGMGAAVLTIGFWLWLSGPSVPPTVDSRAVAEALRPVLIEAMKTAKEPVKPAKSK